MIDIDVLKINHWLNARKITLLQIKDKNKNCIIRLKRKKLFYFTKELNFFKKYLNIQQNDILLKKNCQILYIFQKKNFIN